MAKRRPEVALQKLERAANAVFAGGREAVAAQSTDIRGEVNGGRTLHFCGIR